MLQTFYGSCARGTEETESDIDLMVLLEGPVQAAREIRRIWEVLYPLQLKSARLLSITTVDAALYDQGAYALYRQAKAEGVALWCPIATTVLMTVEYLQERAKRGSQEKFEAVLTKVPDVEPEEFDRL
jgi:nucleotidyltransferase-like protein